MNLVEWLIYAAALELHSRAVGQDRAACRVLLQVEWGDWIRMAWGEA